MDGGAPPGQPEDIALGHQFAQQIRGDLAEVLRVGRLVRVGRRLDHDGVPQTVAGPQRVGALGVQLRGDADLDAYEIPFEGGLQDPGHLEAADAELLGDLDLRFALEVEAACHGRRLHQLSGSHPHRRPARRHTRHGHLLTALLLFTFSIRRSSLQIRGSRSARTVGVQLALAQWSHAQEAPAVTFSAWVRRARTAAAGSSAP